MVEEASIGGTTEALELLCPRKKERIMVVVISTAMAVDRNLKLHLQWLQRQQRKVAVMLWLQHLMYYILVLKGMEKQMTQRALFCIHLLMLRRGSISLSVSFKPLILSLWMSNAKAALTSTKCNRADVALSLLRENKSGYDVVISDVHMPDMDGFKLLEHIGLEMDLPVRKKKHVYKDFEQSGSVEDGDRQQKTTEDADYSSSANEDSWRNSKRRKDEEDEAEDKDDTSSLKKPRVVWSVELHQQFVAAVNQLGIDKAVPKKILEMMNMPGLTRENVASHLQKYRIYLRRLSGQHQGNSFMGTQEAPFGSISPFNGLELQALAASGQIPVQSLATLQAATHGRSAVTKSAITPQVDQRNIFSFESPRLNFVEGQQLSNNGKSMNFLHGIPTNMEPKQLASLHQSANPYGGMMQGGPSNPILAQMTQQQTRAQIQNETNSNYVSRLPSSAGQPLLSNGMASGVLGRSGLMDNVRGPVYNQVSQPSSLVDFSVNPSAGLLGNGFSVGGNSGISPISSKGVLQEETDMELKGSRPDGATYDIFNDLHQPKSQDWSLHNAGLTFDASQHGNMRGNLDASSSFLAQQGLQANQSTVKNSSIGKGVFPGGDERAHGNMPILGQQLNAHHTDNPFRVKAENFPESSYQNALLREHYDQEDLMSALLKQQQEGIGGVESELGFDGYSLDHLPA